MRTEKEIRAALRRAERALKASLREEEEDADAQQYANPIVETLLWVLEKYTDDEYEFGAIQKGGPKCPKN